MTNIGYSAAQQRRNEVAALRRIAARCNAHAIREEHDSEVWRIVSEAWRNVFGRVRAGREC